MAVSDTVVGNLTTIYVALIAAIKAYGLVCGRSFSGGFVVIVSSTLVGLVLVATLTWDVSRRHLLARRGGAIHRVSDYISRGKLERCIILMMVDLQRWRGYNMLKLGSPQDRTQLAVPEGETSSDPHPFRDVTMADFVKTLMTIEGL
ncbi:hypothetical protein K1719_015725 [Acacia pycnantha]|nr:hypothetical protein K1719_015725 [Acacia pycnantha]